jgi:hypothetical protein
VVWYSWDTSDVHYNTNEGKMAIGFVAGAVVGFVLGLAFAIWLTQTAGYTWAEIMHRWRVAIAYRRYRMEIDREIEDLTSGPPT